MNKANKYSLQHADSLDDLATRICGFGYYANHNDDRDHPVPKEAVREYLEVGAAFQLKETEPKLQELKKLADGMYRAAQYLTIERQQAPFDDKVWDIISNQDCIIIGNIYDNPELWPKRQPFECNFE